MSTTEVLVVVTFLFVGYWIVSAIMDHKGKPQDAVGPRPWHVVLGVAETASIEEIRRAYEAKASQSLLGKAAQEIEAAYATALKLRT